MQESVLTMLKAAVLVEFYKEENLFFFFFRSANSLVWTLKGTTVTMAAHFIAEEINK